MSRYSFDAIIFDLDGVITKTAVIHAEAWKAVFDEYLRLREKRNKEPFQEFTYEKDYLSHVDGKPRKKGIKNFLASRGIEIPEGDTEDSSEKETLWGLGNKKNEKFLEIIKKKEVEVFPSTIDLIKELKKAGIAVGVASSSKNCRQILEKAGIEKLFQTRVDGETAKELGLKGKPEADIFVKAAFNLKTFPAKTVIVEDAVSGVRAGRNGGFGLVLGVARNRNQAELFQNGADIAISDLSEISLRQIEEWFHRKPELLFQSWDKVEHSKAQKPETIINPYYSRAPKSFFGSGKKPVFFLDYDGTLTPIVERPELALMLQDMKQIIEDLAKKYTVAVISGRMRENVEKLVGIKEIYYAGSHGFDIAGPELSMVEPRAEKTIPLIAKISASLAQELSDIPGILIEEKKFSVSVHYRLVDEKKHLSGIKDSVNNILKNNDSLCLLAGKKVFEILPKIDWDKGKSIIWLMKVLGLDWKAFLAVYIGDDVTDENAFRAIRTRGLGILVSEEHAKSAAPFRLRSFEEVKKFLKSVL